MLIGKKIRLNPTAEQEVLFRKSAGVARWAYNFYLAENDRVKKNLKLSDRIYKCDICGYEIDRDFNASINLANYRSA